MLMLVRKTHVGVIEGAPDAETDDEAVKTAVPETDALMEDDGEADAEAEAEADVDSVTGEAVDVVVAEGLYDDETAITTNRDIKSQQACIDILKLATQQRSACTHTTSSACWKA
jgi:hypothetical protein